MILADIDRTFADTTLIINTNKIIFNPPPHSPLPMGLVMGILIAVSLLIAFITFQMDNRNRE